MAAETPDTAAEAVPEAQVKTARAVIAFARSLGEIHAEEADMAGAISLLDLWIETYPNHPRVALVVAARKILGEVSDVA